MDRNLIKPTSVNESGLKATRSPNLTLSTQKLADALVRNSRSTPGFNRCIRSLPGQGYRKNKEFWEMNCPQGFERKKKMEIKIGSRIIGQNHPTYFIADIAANHDGSLERAKYLVRLAKKAGADAAKFQNFQAPKIVSDYGFRNSGLRQQSHQSKWKKSVSEVYQSASIPFEWTEELKATCDEVGIDYFSSPYDFEAIDYFDTFYAGL